MHKCQWLFLWMTPAILSISFAVPVPIQLKYARWLIRSHWGEQQFLAEYYRTFSYEERWQLMFLRFQCTSLTSLISSVKSSLLDSCLSKSNHVTRRFHCQRRTRSHFCPGSGQCSETFEIRQFSRVIALCCCTSPGNGMFPKLSWIISLIFTWA